jgi:hypothetical protein
VSWFKSLLSHGLMCRYNKEAPLDGRYLLVKKIGEGATATAHLCLDLAEGNRAVILKNTVLGL